MNLKWFFPYLFLRPIEKIFIGLSPCVPTLRRLSHHFVLLVSTYKCLSMMYSGLVRRSQDTTKERYTMTQMQKIALAICEAVGNDDMMRDIKERIQNNDPIETLTVDADTNGQDFLGMYYDSRGETTFHLTLR